MRSDIGTSAHLEASVIGSLLANPDRLFELPAAFKAEHITGNLNRRVFVALERLARSGVKEVDDSLVAAEARLSDEERGVVSGMFSSSVGGQVATYAGKIVERRRREDLRAALVQAAEALRGDGQTDAVVSELTSQMLALDTPERPETVNYTEAALEALDVFNAEHTGKSRALRTGFPDLDSKVRMHPGNLIVLGARPSIGKSTLALNIASFVATNVGPVAFHSLEMSRVELLFRDVAAATRVPLKSITGSVIAQADLARVTTAFDKRSRSTRLLINDSHFALGSLLRITEKLHRKHKLALVVVDYLQLVEANGGRGVSREAQVSAVSRALKQLAQRLEVPVLALSQMNREAAKRGDASKMQRRGRRDEAPAPEAKLPAPQLHELRESGAIEQDANTVLLLHHPWAESSDPLKRDRGPYEVLIPKQRNGEKGSVLINAELEFARFTSNTKAEVQPSWSNRGENNQ